MPATPNPIHAIIMATFRQFLANNLTLIQQIEQYGQDLKIKNNRWHFTLPTLHQFLSQHHTPIQQTPYPKFRKTLFDHPTNQQLAQLNAIITLHQSTGKVDQNIYSLQPLQ